MINTSLVGRLSVRLGDRRMSNVGLSFLVAGFALVAFVHSVVPLLVITMILFGLGMALTNTGVTALISNAASDRDQGTVLGASSSLDSLSGILAPPFSTKFLATYGSRFAGIESLTLATVALVMGLLNARGERSSAQSESGLTLAAEVEAVKIADG